jgi:hypothetical protein
MSLLGHGLGRKYILQDLLTNRTLAGEPGICIYIYVCVCHFADNLAILRVFLVPNSDQLKPTHKESTVGPATATLSNRYDRLWLRFNF